MTSGAATLSGNVARARDHPDGRRQRRRRPAPRSANQFAIVSFLIGGSALAVELTPLQITLLRVGDVHVLPAALSTSERRRLVRRAQVLAWSSLVWMTAEGIIAIAAGIAAGSIALIGFGIDSAIERHHHLAVLG